MRQQRFLSTTQLKLAPIVLTCMALAACNPASDSETNTTEADIAGLFDQWNASLQTGEPAKVVANYADNGVLLPTVSNKVRTTPAEMKDYFEHFLTLSPYGVIDQQHIRIEGNTAINAGIYTFTINKNDEEKQVQARYTFVYERQPNNEWLIVNHHSSAMPEVIIKETDFIEDIMED